MKASVVIPAYNCCELLKITLSSLEKQDSHYSEYEVVVIDDCSTDGTAGVISNYTGPIKLKTIINSRNLGRAKSRNLGIYASENELIVFLDADIEVEPNFIKTHLKAQSNGMQASVGKVVNHPTLPISGLMRYLEKRGPAKIPPGAEVPGKYFRSGNSSVPKSILMAVGCYDENFTHYGGEDIELGIRLYKKIPLHSLPSAVGYHHHYWELDECLDIIKDYGEHSLPHLFKKHPNFIYELKLKRKHFDWLFSLIMPIICSAPVYKMLKKLAGFKVLTQFIPGHAYNYLIYRNYREGFLKSKNKM